MNGSIVESTMSEIEVEEEHHSDEDELFPSLNQIDQTVFATDVVDMNRIDVYGHICQMVGQYPGYALRIVRRIIREKKVAIDKLPLNKSLSETYSKSRFAKEICESTIMPKNFNSLLVNMSRYLFEAPHSEETNYFSTCHTTDEKPFLLFLAMFLANTDLSTDFSSSPEPREKDLGEPSTDYLPSAGERIETLKLLFEGQTRKFTSLKFLAELGEVDPDSAELFPLQHAFAEAVQKAWAPTPLLKNDHCLELSPVSNELGDDFTMQLLYLKEHKLLKKVDHTEVCLSLVASLFALLRVKIPLIPATIRIMLKLRLSMMEEKLVVVGAEDAQILGELLLGVWFNQLFRFP